MKTYCADCKHQRIPPAPLGERCMACVDHDLFKRKPERFSFAPAPDDCNLCAHHRTSPHDEPCRTCLDTKPLKWTPIPAETIWPNVREILELIEIALHVHGQDISLIAGKTISESITEHPDGWMFWFNVPGGSTKSVVLKTGSQ